MKEEKKINIVTPLNWQHHRFGWNYVVENMMSLQNDYGINCFTNGTYHKFISNYDQIFNKKWLAFFHITKSDPNLIYHLENNQVFHSNLEKCKGIFVLSENSKAFLQKYLNVKIESLKHPIPPMFSEFNPDLFLKKQNKTMYFIGHWLRDYKTFDEIQSPFYKIIIKCDHTEKKINGIQFLEKNDYDSIFESNILFLSLIDSSANNTILECISNNTPLIINRLPAIEEYLGKEYPLFYENINQAQGLLTVRKIFEGYEYLKNLNKTFFSVDFFIESIKKSDIYKNIYNTKLY